MRCGSRGARGSAGPPSDRSGTSGPVRDQGTGPVPDQSASDAGLPVLRSREETGVRFGPTLLDLATEGQGRQQCGLAHASRYVALGRLPEMRSGGGS